jgi:hypothetical protein
LLTWKIYNTDDVIYGVDELKSIGSEKLGILTHSMGLRNNSRMLYTIKKAVSVEYDVVQIEWKMYGCLTCQSWFIATNKDQHRLAVLARAAQEVEAKEDRSQSIM